MEGDLQRSVGRNLRLHRQGRKLSQEAFAEVVGVHRTYLGGLERGERNLTLRSVERLAAAIGADPMWLLGTPPVSGTIAWVPDDADRDSDAVTWLGVGWIQAQASAHGGRAVLVTNAFSDVADHAVLGAFQRGVTHFTPRSGRAAPVRVPVLAYLPSRETLDFATGLARGSSLCVIEGTRDRLVGWAAELRAINLLTGQATPPPVPEVEDLLERLAHYGNDGYRTDYGRDRAGSVLEELLQQHLLDPAVVVGALAAKNISPLGQRWIEGWIKHRNPQD